MSTASTENIYAKIGRFTDIQSVRGIKTRLNSDLDRIRQNPNLSDQGKRVAIARAYTAAHGKLSESRAEYEEAARVERLRVERSTYGPGSVDPTDVVAQRDAFQRTEQLTKEQAPRAYHMAQISGDTGLAKAIAYRAVKHGWDEVVSTHALDNPAFEERVAAIRDLESTDISRQADSIVFGLATPSEFGNYNAGGIALFAKAADKTDEADGTTDSGPAIL